MHTKENAPITEAELYKDVFGRLVAHLDSICAGQKPDPDGLLLLHDINTSTIANTLSCATSTLGFAVRQVNTSMRNGLHGRAFLIIDDLNSVMSIQLDRLPDLVELAAHEKKKGSSSGRRKKVKPVWLGDNDIERRLKLDGYISGDQIG